MSKIAPALVMNRAWRPVLPSRKTVNKRLVVIVALPAVLVAVNAVNPPLLLVIVALPAVLVSRNSVNPLLMRTALPAVLAPWKNIPASPPIEKVGALEELLTMPVPVRRVAGK